MMSVGFFTGLWCVDYKLTVYVITGSDSEVISMGVFLTARSMLVATERATRLPQVSMSCSNFMSTLPLSVGILQPVTDVDPKTSLCRTKR